MKTADLREFAVLLEKHLPPIAAVHQQLRERGFAAWAEVMDERLNLIEPSAREAERSIMILLCREEICNFTRYMRDMGGDGLELPELAKLRRLAQASNSSQPLSVLQSDRRMQCDRLLTEKFAGATKQRATSALTVERDRYIQQLISMLEAQPGKSMRDCVRASLGGSFAKRGFSPKSARTTSMCFEKTLSPSCSILACVDEIHRLGMPGWRGDTPISFHLWLGDRYQAFYLPTCCRRRSALPLRLTGLVPGLYVYTGAQYLWSTPPSVDLPPGIVVLTMQEAVPTSNAERAFLLAHMVLATECLLTVLETVENAIVAASSDLQAEM